MCIMMRATGVILKRLSLILGALNFFSFSHVIIIFSFRSFLAPESDLTPTFNIYSPHSSPIFISFNFDVPPDIERLEIADETLGRVFTLTVNSIWRSRFAITIQRKDLTQGWSNVLKILWRAGAPANYKCSLRGALNMQTRLREGWRLRVVLQTLNANVTGSPINIYRDVTVETDPRASNICFVLLIIVVSM